MRRGALLLLALTTAVPVLLAQEGPAVFDSREWDFGAIREADGAVSHAFTVFNGDSRPLRLTRAIPGCSCISATLPGADIAPGQSATVEVRFTPAGASGPVERTIEIQAGGRSLGMLSIRADVLPADRSIQERYPVVLAEGLYASRADVRFGYLERGRPAGKVVFIANASDKPMRLRAEGLSGTHYRLVCPDTLAPGEEGRLEVWCDTPADPTVFATLRATLRLTPDGVPALREMPISGLCLTQAQESPDAPRLRNGPMQVRRRPLSRAPRGTLEIFNDGATDLILHAVEVPAGIRCAFEPGTHIAPGKSLTLTLSGAAGRDARMTVFSNDPLRPAKEIPIITL